MTPRDDAGARLAGLRRDFDAVFSAPPAVASADSSGFLAIRVAGDPYALDVAEVQEYVADRRIVPLRGRAHGLLGLAGVRGAIVPVYDLAALLGYPAGRSESRGFVLCRSEESVALAVDGLEAYVRVPRADISAASGGGERVHVRRVARIGGIVRPVASVPSVLDAIKARACVSR